MAARLEYRPYTVWWKGDIITVCTGKTEKPIDFAKFKDNLKKQIAQTTRFIEEEVLLGLLTIDELEKVFDFLPENPTETDREKLDGLLFDARKPPYSNPQSNYLLVRMAKAGALGMKMVMLPDGTQKISFDRKLALPWLGAFTEAVKRLFCISHITEGLAGRATEEALLSPTSPGNSTSNYIVVPKYGTAAFNSRHRKQVEVTSALDPVQRMVPYLVHRQLYTLVRVVRPIELQVVLEFLVPKEQRHVPVQAYSTKIWASFGVGWQAQFLSESLGQFTSHNLGLGLEMKVREWRHFATALRRRFLPYTNDVEESKPSQLADAADRLAGHAPAVARHHYGLTPEEAASGAKSDFYYRVCCDWHQKVFELPSSRDETQAWIARHPNWKVEGEEEDDEEEDDEEERRSVPKRKLPQNPWNKAQMRSKRPPPTRKREKGKAPVTRAQGKLRAATSNDGPRASPTPSGLIPEVVVDPPPSRRRTPVTGMPSSLLCTTVDLLLIFRSQARSTSSRASRSSTKLDEEEEDGEEGSLYVEDTEDEPESYSE